MDSYDILEVFDHYGIEYKTTGNDEVDFLCPFHEDLNFGNAKWNYKKEIFKCFSCGKGGNIFKFVALMEGSWCSLDHAEKLIASDFTYTGGYDTSVLKKILEQRLRSTSKVRNVLLTKCVEKMLDAYTDHTPSLTHFKKWLPVITYINFHSAVQFTKEETNNLMNIYTQFFHELNMEKTT